MQTLLGACDQSEPEIGFTTKWTVSGDAAGRTITLPLVAWRNEGPLVYNFVVDWGDGTTSTVTAYNDPNRAHTYAVAGTYTVEIKGVCEGWSFNYGGDMLKIVDIVHWGTTEAFSGFKFLYGGFYGCTNIESLGKGTILASGSGVGEQGFYFAFAMCSKVISIPVDLFINHHELTKDAFGGTFLACSSLQNIPKDIFRYAAKANHYAFMNTFSQCTSITSIPEDLFKYNTEVDISAFYGVFSRTNITSIPENLFRYNTKVSESAFSSAFYRCTSLASIPAGLFRYNTEASVDGFRQAFYGCSSLTTIPSDLFRYNTKVSTNGFRSCFYQCTALVGIPEDLFRYNVAVGDAGFRSTFNGCTSLESVPEGLFRYNVAVGILGFQYTFLDCEKLQLNPYIFFAAGEEGTRFKDRASDFTACFARANFSGTQGAAPELWNCDFGSATPITGECFGDTGNSSSSISNFDNIPSTWINP